MREVGSTTIEMVFWIPLLLMILAAIVQFGLYFNAKNACQAAAFEATRQATVSANPERTAKDVVEGYARHELSGWETGNRLEANIKFHDKGTPDEAIVVSISYETPLFIPKILGLNTTGHGFKAVGTSEMEMEERP